MNRLFLLLFGAMSLVAHAQVPNYVPTDGLVAWYPFNGNAMNELNTENEFNVNGPVNVSDRFGIPSNAYYFDGIDDEIIASNPGVSGSEISLSFWYQSAQVDYSAYLIAFGGPAWGTYFEVMNNHWSTQTPGPCYGPRLVRRRNPCQSWNRVDAGLIGLASLRSYSSGRSPFPK